MMELVIKIDDKMYELVKHFEEGLRLIDKKYDNVDTALLRAIINGTPLPEHHGRIVDIDEVIKCIEEAQGNDVVWVLNLIEWACSKRTIIEADKEGTDAEQPTE